MTIDELKAALEADPEKAAAFRKALASMTPDTIGSDSEALSAAAAAAGIEITPEEIERDRAASMELDDSELSAITAGECADGHDAWCVAAWYCFTAMVHGDGAAGWGSCWSEWGCWGSYHVAVPCDWTNAKEHNCWAFWEWRGCDFVTK